MELKIFLKQATTLVKEQKFSQVVVGNESADLDSIISANLLAFAYYKMGMETIIPLINCNREDYKLRTESYGLLKRYEIDENDLIFIDDIDTSLIQNPQNLKVIVVDHNKLPDNLRAWDKAVVSVFDHHQDIDMYTDAKPRIFETVGSCSTLVAQFILENKPDIFNNEEVAILNISPILVDTVNLDPEQGRVTDKDVEIAEALKALISDDTQKLYDDLQFMTSDVSALSSTDLLRKDYKQWTNENLTYGMSSLPLSLDDWLTKDNEITKACEGYMQRNSLDLLLVMCAYVKNGFKRELVVIAPNLGFLNSFNAMLNNAGLDLSNYSVELKSKNAIATFNQGGLGFSRKKIQPLIEAFLEKNE